MKRIITFVGLIGFLVIGCNTSTTTITESLDASGNPVKMTVEEKKESPLTNKTFSVAGSVTAIKVESAGSASSETALPNVLVGGSAASISSSPKGDNRPTIGYSWSCGILSSLTSSSASSGSITYIGLTNETAAETAKRIKTVVDLKNATVSSDASVDSGSLNSK